MRLVNLSSDHIVKKMHHELATLHGMGHSNWVSHIKNILDETDLNYLWEHGTPSLKFTKHIRGHMELFFRNDWHQEINNSTKNPKLRLYKEIKETFLPEPYLFINISKYRHAIAQLRLSSHHLEIATSGYTRPITPANLRFCVACPGKVGDEIHFLIECQSLSIIREKLFAESEKFIPHFTSLTSKNKFPSIMNTDSMDLLLPLGNFISKAKK